MQRGDITVADKDLVIRNDFGGGECLLLLVLGEKDSPNLLSVLLKKSKQHIFYRQIRAN